LLNFTCFAIVYGTIQPFFAKRTARGPLVLLGQASLEVFCVHLLVCFAALALVGDGGGQPLWVQAAIIVTALAILYAVAKMFAKREMLPARQPRED
jgi:peptidoglycan/LPS O-acetylase OafA/YrhL